jgi:hypothetical protein
MNTRALAIAALIAGLITAVLSAVPIVNLLNCVLCGWLWVGGILGVFFYQRNAPGAALRTEDGLVIGAVTGVVAAIIGAILGAIFNVGNAALVSALNTVPQIGDQVGPLRSLVAAGGFSLIGLGCNLIFYALFGAIGGLIGAAILKPKTTITTT